MVERYREDAIRAIFFARWEAQQAGSSYIEAKHILLGLTHDADSKANQLFALSAHVEAFRTPLKPYASIQSSTSKDLPFSNASKRVLAYATKEADKMASTPIGTEHLLLGLLREKQSDVPQTLAKAGIDLRSVRKRIRATQGHSIPERKPDDRETSLRPLRPFAAFALLVVVLSLFYMLVRLADS
jgi:ATP-dependent Clp protease ATP-binding subunit ClpC